MILCYEHKPPSTAYVSEDIHRQIDDIYDSLCKKYSFKEKDIDSRNDAKSYFDQGISYICDLMDLAVKHNIIEKAGAWFSYEGERLGQGRDNLKKYIEDNPKLLSKLEKAVFEKLKIKPLATLKPEGKSEKKSEAE